MACIPGVPIEALRQVVNWARKRLVELGSAKPILRIGGAVKAGLCATDNGNFIIDEPFRDEYVVGIEGDGVEGSVVGDTRTVERLAEERIVRWWSIGVFIGGNAKAVVAYFGM